MATLAHVVPAIIDSHVHQWDPFSTPREASRLAGLYRRSPRLLGALFPVLVDKGARDLVLTPEHVAQPYLPENLRDDVTGTVESVGVRVESVVHVEADWKSDDPAEETAWVDALPFGVDGRPTLAAVVGHADPRKPGLAELLDRHLAASTRFRGIRCMATWHDDAKVKRWSDGPGLLRSRPFLQGFAAVTERGLTFDAYVYSQQLDDVAALAREYPDTTIVLDHYGPPVGWLGSMGRSTGRSATEQADLLARWQHGISRLAEQPNVVAKHSGLAFPMLGLKKVGMIRERLAETVAPLVDHTTDAFGEDRVLFGSNFPMDKAITAYATIVGALADVLAPRGEQVLRKVFRENAQRVYSL